MSFRDKKLVYHLTDIENLPSIREYGILPRSQVIALGLAFTDVADHEILKGRESGNLEDYVPFHFRQRTPFDYAVVRARPDRAFALLGVRRVYARAKGWSIITRHPLSQQPATMNWDEGFEAVNWSEMDRHADFSDREHKQVLMAEALSPGSVPFSQVQSIFVATEASAQRVRELIGIQPTVNGAMLPRGCL